VRDEAVLDHPRQVFADVSDGLDVPAVVLRLRDGEEAVVPPGIPAPGLLDLQAAHRPAGDAATGENGIIQQGQIVAGVAVSALGVAGALIGTE
jgi:hypothetical protein